jgi:hypothetical protein
MEVAMVANVTTFSQAKQNKSSISIGGEQRANIGLACHVSGLQRRLDIVQCGRFCSIGN